MAEATPEPAPAGEKSSIFGNLLGSASGAASSFEGKLGSFTNSVTAQKEELANKVKGNVSNLTSKFEAFKNAGTAPAGTPEVTTGGRRRRTRKSKKSKKSKSKRSRSKKSKKSKSKKSRKSKRFSRRR